MAGPVNATNIGLDILRLPQAWASKTEFYGHRAPPLFWHCRPESVSFVQSVVLLTGRRTKPVPGIPHLVIMNFGQIVRRIELEDLDIEPAHRTQQRVGGDHPVALALNQPR